jgi:ribonuclease P protein component
LSQRDPDDPQSRDDGPPPLARLKKRADFQRTSGGIRWRGRAFALQARRREDGAAPRGARVGLTATRKIGGAVARNRMRRRLKEALRLTRNLETRDDHDYVLVAQREALTLRFEGLCADLATAFAAVSAKSLREPSDRDRRK